MGAVKNDELKQEDDMAKDDFLPEPRTISHAIRQSESMRNKWGTAIQKEPIGLSSNGTFDANTRPLPNGKVNPVKLALKIKFDFRRQ